MGKSMGTEVLEVRKLGFDDQEHKMLVENLSIDEMHVYNANRQLFKMHSFMSKEEDKNTNVDVTYRLSLIHI